MASFIGAWVGSDFSCCRAVCISMSMSMGVIDLHLFANIGLWFGEEGFCCVCFVCVGLPFFWIAIIFFGFLNGILGGVGGNGAGVDLGGGENWHG